MYLSYCFYRTNVNAFFLFAYLLVLLFFLVESVIVLFVFYCFFYRRPISQRWNSDNRDTKKKMEERSGVFWLSKQDFQKERTKVCTRVLKISYWSRKSKDLKHSPYFTKITADIVYIDILISILMSESKTLFLSYHLRSKRIVYDKTVISFTVLS